MMSRSEKVTIAALTGFIVLLFLSLILTPACVLPKESATRSTLARLAGAAILLKIGGHELPDNGLPSLFQMLKSEGILDYLLRSDPGIDKGLDSWGWPIIFETRSDGIVCLRSMGSNGLDDAGKKDDIQIAFDRDNNYVQ